VQALGGDGHLGAQPATGLPGGYAAGRFVEAVRVIFVPFRGKTSDSLKAS